jgi:2-keto-4-pentenoate hydratase/2-oxohepta-3-ene-1,7-dioic acid hydratase in catechol pathway
MRFIRYQFRDQPPCFGWVLDNLIGALEGNPFSEFRRLEANLPLDKVQLLSPVVPGKIICIDNNYGGYAQQIGSDATSLPALSLKPPSAVIGFGQPIVLPPQSQQVEHGAELAIIIGKIGRWIPHEKALEYILGYTIGNDVIASDIEQQDGYSTRARSFDTFCPLGPWLETEFDASDALITCHVNKEMRQMASTRDMVFTIRQLIAFASSVMTLYPGDIIMTGTPSGSGRLKPGDTVEISIEGIGKLSNPVITPTPVK